MLRSGFLTGVIADVAKEPVKRITRRVDRNRDSKAGRIEAAKQEIAVRQSQGASRSIAGRPWNRPGAFGSNSQTAGVEGTDRSAPGRDRLYRERRSQELNVSDSMLPHVLEVAIDTRNVGARSPHVEGDDALETCPSPRGGRSHHSARRPAQERVLRGELFGPHQASCAGHQVQR